MEFNYKCRKLRGENFAEKKGETVKGKFNENSKEVKKKLIERFCKYYFKKSVDVLFMQYTFFNIKIKLFLRTCRQNRKLAIRDKNVLDCLIFWEIHFC